MVPIVVLLHSVMSLLFFLTTTQMDASLCCGLLLLLGRAGLNSNTNLDYIWNIP